MPRINIEDSIFADERFWLLQEKLGTEMAIGKLICFWRIAQKYIDSEGVPLEVFNRHEWKMIIDVGLAEVRGDFIYAKGSEKEFSWMKGRREAGRLGGLASGISRNEKKDEKIIKDKNIKELRRSKTKQTPSKTNPHTHTLSHTHTHTQNIHENIYTSRNSETASPGIAKGSPDLDEKLIIEKNPEKISEIPRVKNSPNRMAKKDPMENLNSETFDLIPIPEAGVGDLIRSWFEFTRLNQPWRTNLDPKNFENGIMRILKVTGLNINQLTEVFHWAKEEEFWHDKIFSPQALLKKSKNDLRKIDNVLVSFRRTYKKRSELEQCMMGNY